MIRKRHAIDTKLVNFFISENKFDEEINLALLNWYNSLEDKNHQNSRKTAIEFLKILSKKLLREIGYPLSEREILISIFDPLELLLRTALSIKQPGEGEHYVRDHLSHTVRNVLFTNYLLKKYNPKTYSSWQTQLFITAIFHDLAYPIEKIKKVAKKLGGSTFKELLNSKGEIEIELNRPDDLLEMLNYFGNTIKSLEKKMAECKPENKNDLDVNIKKIKHIYREIISVAIAGKGLFDASHAISSVVLFLRPIINHWKDSEAYQDINLTNIADICLAMAYHDRSFLIQKINGFEIPVILKVMRLSDELQEWDRESDSFIYDVAITEDDLSSILSFNLVMRDKTNGEKKICDAVFFIPDKINGILPIVNEDEKIKLFIKFPNEINEIALKERLIKKVDKDFLAGKTPLKYTFIGNGKGKDVEIVFHHNEATIEIQNNENENNN